MKKVVLIVLSAGSFGLVWSCGTWAAEDFPKPYSPPCVERENVFEFTEKPKIKALGNDKFEITFAVKGNCDVAVGIVDGEGPSTGSTGSPQAGSHLREDATAGTAGQGKVVRHLGAGVLGANAPAPFQKNSLTQTIYWNGKDDLDWYHKEPGKLKVRVMLGLKPEFDKRLGGTSPHNLPGGVLGVALDAGGAYVFVKGGGDHGHATLRKFDREGRYVRTLICPALDVPLDRLAGLGYVEYEKGVQTLHGALVHETTAKNAFWVDPLDGRGLGDLQAAIVAGRLYYPNAGVGYHGGCLASLMYWWGTDGSTEPRGQKGVPLVSGKEEHMAPRLAASPDGKWLYVGGHTSGYYSPDMSFLPVIMKWSTEGNAAAQAFVGDKSKPGSDDYHLNNPTGLDCDAQGRVYVSDQMNNRVQIYDPAAKFLKTLAVERPKLIRVHPKTGGLYLLHYARVEGRSVARLTKFSGFDSLKEEYHVDGLSAVTMAVDGWSAKPRVWLGGGARGEEGRQGHYSVRIFEEDGGTLKMILDFDEEAKKEAGENYIGRWGGSIGGKVVCDPVRERVCYGNSVFFDLATGRKNGHLPLPGPIDDIAFDKRGYLHCHFNPGFYRQGVGRLNPDERAPNGQHKECPYDYGEEASGQGWLGIIPVRDQPGAKFFQDGLGVNMRGDVAEQCNIYFAPKMDDESRQVAMQGVSESLGRGFWNEEGHNYEDFLRKIEDARKRGEEVYSLRRRPGIPLVGGTVWTFDASGDLRKECAVIAGDLINGTMLDEDGSVYFVNGRTRMFGQKPFLAGQGGTLGAPEDKTNRNPFTGTLIKTIPLGQCLVLLENAPVPLDQLPGRPADMWKGKRCWVEGAQWLYAGASPIVAGGCSCPTQRLHTDWYKRTCVPEMYRHSIGILDSAGNLILHLGRYGNMDDAQRMKTGTTDIPMTFVRFVSGTDNYLVFDDWNERVVVLKLNYHAEESVGIGEVTSGK